MALPRVVPAPPRFKGARRPGSLRAADAGIYASAQDFRMPFGPALANSFGKGMGRMYL
ncbi:hypothetical protein Salmuc_05580 [Salipiger mucosus DSM 16094]|uniref:Uncharacterized protein n=1 Tax=Salipiger mucosus DSM 16094 TaxID=1123237 RepID=S9S096_9RHOB|nr:hypothetical protein Salmuc_05580 [Salipiger mucosus DSM 16094]